MEKTRKPISNITSMSIEGFRAFGSRQEFPVRPINLIFGPNSSGKSALIKALLYSFEKQTTKQVDLSGINPHVNAAGDVQNTNISYRLNANIYSEEIRAKTANEAFLKLQPKLDAAKHIELTIRPNAWDKYLDHKPYKLKFGKSTFIHFNYDRNLNEMPEFPFWKHLKYLVDEAFKSNNITKLMPKLSAKSYFNMIKKCIANNVAYYSDIKELSTENIFGGQFEYLYGTVIEEYIFKLFNDDDDDDHYDAYCKFDEIYSDAVYSVFNNIEDEFSVSEIYSDRILFNLSKNNLTEFEILEYSIMLVLYSTFDIRRIYQSFYEFEPGNISKILYLSVDRESVDLMISQKNDTRSPLNTYLRSNDSLKFCNEWFELTSVPFKLIQHEQLVGIESGRPYFGSYNLPIDVMDMRVNHIFPLKDVGYGIKKLIPVLSAVSYSSKYYQDDMYKYDLVAIEEPEIHLHPKLQSELGDLFVNDVINDSGKIYFIETHSENLLQRILRRVREGIVSHESINVLYIHPGIDINGAKIECIEIDSNGQFKTPWPVGFFDTRVDDVVAGYDD